MQSMLNNEVPPSHDLAKLNIFLYFSTYASHMSKSPKFRNSTFLDVSRHFSTPRTRTKNVDVSALGGPSIYYESINQLNRRHVHVKTKLSSKFGGPRDERVQDFFFNFQYKDLNSALFS